MIKLLTEQVERIKIKKGSRSKSEEPERKTSEATPQRGRGHWSYDLAAS